MVTALWGSRSRRFLAGMAAMLAAGCMANFYETPRPFEGRHRNDPMLDSILQGASLEVRPVQGLPADEARALSRAISQLAHEHDIAAVTEQGARIADRLTGIAEVAVGFTLPDLPPRLFVIGTGKKPLPVRDATGPQSGLTVARNSELRFAWVLTGADGNVKDRMNIALPISGRLPELNRSERNRIAEQTVAWLRATLDEEAGSTIQVVARQDKPIILVSPVAGASGDGRVSLTTALAEMLTSSGACDVLASSEQARIPKGRTAYRVKGLVKMRDGGGPDKQIVTLSWTLSDLAGREIGTVSQENAVPRGSLDGAWGQTAYDAALGARDGLLALIERSAIPAPVE